MDVVTEHEKLRIFWGHAASLVCAWTLAKGLCFFSGKFEHSNFTPIGSMYAVFSHISLIFMVNVGKYTMDLMGYCSGSRKETGSSDS